MNFNEEFTGFSGMGFPNLYISRNKPVELAAEIMINDSQQLSLSPAELEIIIRKQLAEQLIETIIREDLLKIEVDESSNNPLNQQLHVKASLKLIQE